MFVLTKSCVELLFCQVLIIIDVIVFQQVKQRALREILGQTFLLDDLKWEYIDVWLEKLSSIFWISEYLSSTLSPRSCIYIPLVWKGKYILKYMEWHHNRIYVLDLNNEEMLIKVCDRSQKYWY